MDDQQFALKSTAALDSLYRKLTAAGEKFEFDADLNGGALQIEFEDPPGRFVVSPNSPVKQIWLSALVRSFKLDWDEARGAFVLPASGQSLDELLADVISQQLGTTVVL